MENKKPENTTTVQFHEIIDLSASELIPEQDDPELPSSSTATGLNLALKRNAS